MPIFLIILVILGAAIMQKKNVIEVKATTESLNQIGPNNTWLDCSEPFAALPSRLALGKKIIVEWNGEQILIPVRDVGPWNTTDAYWLRKERPRAETDPTNFDSKKTSSWNLHLKLTDRTNGAGMDLSTGAWALLGHRTPNDANEIVRWRFASQGEA